MYLGFKFLKPIAFFGLRRKAGQGRPTLVFAAPVCRRAAFCFFADCAIIRPCFYCGLPRGLRPAARPRDVL